MAHPIDIIEYKWVRIYLCVCFKKIKNTAWTKVKKCEDPTTIIAQIINIWEPAWNKKQWKSSHGKVALDYHSEYILKLRHYKSNWKESNTYEWWIKMIQEKVNSCQWNREVNTWKQAYLII